MDVHEGIDNTLMILQHRLKATDKSPEIQLIRNYGNLSNVECYAGQVNQVFMNILVNALDALEDSIPNGLIRKSSLIPVGSRLVLLSLIRSG
ncbi:hypothetical protein [Nostoc sp. 'Peltigera malacea cyanobiont' DB3992]|uniref:hypothetical protein n=1 Tax=Nostoc sp. 'Peltigera malacea cyanobiont' DB3992 TaxID=1206980 RepID=UPI0027BA0B75|nr:hypothetical protein [Nostoc sp. 'Peltigera malacea cyanobiont' DB3992]